MKLIQLFKGLFHPPSKLDSCGKGSYLELSNIPQIHLYLLTYQTKVQTVEKLISLRL